MRPRTFVVTVWTPTGAPDVAESEVREAVEAQVLQSGEESVEVTKIIGSWWGQELRGQVRHYGPEEEAL